MEDSAVARLLPPGTRTIRLFTAPEVASGAVSVPGWEDAGMQLVKLRSRGRAVVGNGVFLKEYIYRSRWDRFRQRFKTPRPFVSLDAARRLTELGIPTPRVLVAARGIAPDGDIRDLLVTEQLPSDVVFGDREIRTLTGMPLPLVAVVLKMHDGGVCHGDLSLRNWYSTPEGEWGLIDLDGATVGKAVSKRLRTDELARLVSSWLCAKDGYHGTLAGLRQYSQNLADEYTKLGGAVDRRRLEKRSIYLANRFRVKYLKMDPVLDKLK